MKKGMIVTAAILSFFIVEMKSNAEMKISPGGITFSDNTTQTTSATGGSGRWSASGFDIYYNSGNVGIGTKSPDQMLHIVGVNPRIWVEGSSGNPEVNFLTDLPNEAYPIL